MANLNQSSEPIAQPLTELPDKKYFTIGEVAKICQLKSHVLRYWEQVFPQLEPSKRRGRRYYQRADLELVLEIKSLLHDQGFTIQGAKAKLVQKSTPIEERSACSEQSKAVAVLQLIQQELQEFRSYIQTRF